VSGLRALLKIPAPESSSAAREQALSALRAALDETAFAAASAAGRLMTLEEAVACALADGETGCGECAVNRKP
jgi:hypothetical protein